MTNDYQYIKLSVSGSRADVTLNRPQRHNAFIPEMVDELYHAFGRLENDGEIHFVVLSGEGTSFCAGADIKWFAGAIDREKSASELEYQRMAELLKRIATFPKVTIAAARGNVLGGGNGLLAACDFTVATQSVNFAFGEVKLGLIPANIMPFVARKVSVQNLKKLMFSGSAFGSFHAQAIGLVDFVTEDYELETFVEKLIAELKNASPNALLSCKILLLKVESGEINMNSGNFTSSILTDLIYSEEGQEGLRAFLEKRKPSWLI